MRDRKGVNPYGLRGEEELGGAEGGEIVIRLYYVRKKFFLNKKIK